MWRYAISTTLDVRRRALDEDYVIYRPDSGDTHLLTGPLAWVYSQLLSKPQSLPELVQLASQEIPDSEFDGVPEAIEEALDEMDKLQLLEQVA